MKKRKLGYKSHLLWGKDGIFCLSFPQPRDSNENEEVTLGSKRKHTHRSLPFREAPVNGTDEVDARGGCTVSERFRRDSGRHETGGLKGHGGTSASSPRTALPLTYVSDERLPFRVILLRKWNAPVSSCDLFHAYHFCSSVVQADLLVPVR